MDRTTEMLSDYSCNLSYEDLSPQVIKQVKRTLIDNPRLRGRRVPVGTRQDCQNRGKQH